jgi:hypothetical protein
VLIIKCLEWRPLRLRYRVEGCRSGPSKATLWVTLLRTQMVSVQIELFPIELFQGRMPSHTIRMRMEELTPKELSSVNCPTCGVAAGEGCHLHSGSPRFEPHLDRKLSAIEALEQKKILDDQVRAASKYLRAK